MPTRTTKKLLLVSSDLFLSSQIEGAARKSELSFRAVNSLAALDEDSTAADVVVVVDLELPGLDKTSLATRVSESSAIWIAYAAHVKTQLFDAARLAGIERLHSKGEISRHLESILAEL